MGENDGGKKEIEFGQCRLYFMLLVLCVCLSVVLYFAFLFALSEKK